MLYTLQEFYQSLEQNYKPGFSMKSAHHHQPREVELHHVLLRLLISAAVLHSSRAVCRTDPPVDPDHPFLFMWNAPTELCQERFEVRLDLSNFHLVSSTLKTATDQRISIFYTDRFGIFPYVDEDTGESVEEDNPRIPQEVDLDDHREEAEDDIENYIPEVGQAGLAVLDFEDWRPQWVRNWGSKDIYRQLSIEAVQKRNASLSEDEAEARAKLLFDRAARRYFTRSVRIGRRLRPARLWGYYLFPDCYNYDYHQDMEHYSGECPEIERERNDNLWWLWDEVSALYPSIYLEEVLRDSRQARLYVRHRIREAMRVSTLASDGNFSTPVYAYIRPVYKDSVEDYMSEYDLVNTIGEAAALGASGVISWGDMQVTDTEDSCIDAKLHLERVMNRYIVNVSTATQMCSRALCQSQGRCVRKHWDSDDYLHLDSRRFYIQRYRSGLLAVKGDLTQEDVDWFDRRFDCLCYRETPCRAALTLNLVPEQDVNFAWSHSAGGQLTFAPHQTQLLVLLLWMYFVI